MPQLVWLGINLVVTTLIHRLIEFDVGSSKMLFLRTWIHRSRDILHRCEFKAKVLIRLIQSADLPTWGSHLRWHFRMITKLQFLKIRNVLPRSGNRGQGVQIPFSGANAGTRHLHSNGSCECQSKLSCDCSWGFIETVMISLLYLAYRGEQ